jgi:hypothetical protein
MSMYIMMIVVVMCWVMLLYLGFQLIDIRSDLRVMRRQMDLIADRKIR